MYSLVTGKVSLFHRSCLLYCCNISISMNITALNNDWISMDTKRKPFWECDCRLSEETLRYFLLKPRSFIFCSHFTVVFENLSMNIKLFKSRILSLHFYPCLHFYRCLFYIVDVHWWKIKQTYWWSKARILHKRKGRWRHALKWILHYRRRWCRSCYEDLYIVCYFRYIYIYYIHRRPFCYRCRYIIHILHLAHTAINIYI